MRNEITFLVSFGKKRWIMCFKKHSFKYFLFIIISFFKGYVVERVDD